MFRLFKLALYGLVAYGVYDLVQELINDPSTQRGGGSRGPGGGAKRQVGQQPRRQLGKVERTGDGAGSSMSHRVGRGVRV